MKVLFSAPFDFIKNIIEELGLSSKLEITYKEIWKENELPSEGLDYDAWIPNPGQNFVINKKILSNFSCLRVISTPSTGTNHIDLNDCKNNSVKVFGLLDQMDGLNEITASAEFTFLKVLASIRNLRSAWNEVSAGRWRENENLMRGKEIDELEFGLIGMGRIGKKLVSYLEPFNPKSIKYYDPNTVCHLNSAKKVSSIEKIFASSDVIIMCLSLNENTFNLIGEKLFNLMKKNAILINTSRGEIIVESELINFLMERPDVKFSADVIQGEVVNQHLSNNLISLHNNNRINLTPHIAGASSGSQTKAAILAIRAIESYE